MTYENAYEILGEVRRGINEYTTAYLQGTDTTGAYSNAEILHKINDAQKLLFDRLIVKRPQVFFKSAPLTPVANVLTPPSDFYRIRRLEDSQKLKVWEEDLDKKRMEGEDGSPHHYYWKGGTLVVDADVSEVFTLYYTFRPRDLHSGMSSAGGALSLTLDAAFARPIADYYNGMVIENITDSWVDTISDYSAARVAVLAAQTGAASKYYGLVSDLPEALHPFIARRATLHMRATYKSLEKPTMVDLGMFKEDLDATLNGLLGTFHTDTPMRELFE